MRYILKHECVEFMCITECVAGVDRGIRGKAGTRQNIQEAGRPIAPTIDAKNQSESDVRLLAKKATVITAQFHMYAVAATSHVAYATRTCHRKARGARECV